MQLYCLRMAALSADTEAHASPTMHTAAALTRERPQRATEPRASAEVAMAIIHSVLGQREPMQPTAATTGLVAASWEAIRPREHRLAPWEQLADTLAINSAS